MAKRFVGVKLERELFELLQRAAAAQRKTASAVIREALQTSLEPK